MRTRLLRISGLALVLALVGAACGSSDNQSARDGADGSTASTATSTNTTDNSQAAGLRATLTQQLKDHVWLAGISVNTAVNTGLTSPATKAAMEALDKNSVDLSDSIESVYPGAGKTFLPLWRKHIGFFVDYTAAGAKGDKAGQEKARKELDGYREDFGAFIASANPNLTKQAVANALIGHVNTVFDAIDASLAKSPTVFEKLQIASTEIEKDADVLAGAIAKQKNLGDSNSPASDLRTTLNAQLDDHVWLAGVGINTAINTGPTSAATKAALDTLDANSVDLSKSIDSVYPGAGKTFLPLWRKHIQFFVEYTLAGAKGDEAGQSKARDGLDEYRADFGAFIASANPNLSKEAVADELVPHVDSLFDTIDAALKKSPETPQKLAEAAKKMHHTAEVLAGAIAKQKALS
ncbi:MAG TPA: hypothetical protein VM600_01430 [Actinomycetota bacterium]|nr:hypothetical protein [Actinomycetota bacterium]